MTTETMRPAAGKQLLIQLGAKAVLSKAGILTDEPVDYLFCARTRCTAV